MQINRNRNRNRLDNPELANGRQVVKVWMVAAGRTRLPCCVCVELQDLRVLHQTNETVKLMPAQQIRWAFIAKCHLKTAARALAATASIIVIP